MVCVQRGVGVVAAETEQDTEPPRDNAAKGGTRRQVRWYRAEGNKAAVRMAAMMRIGTDMRV